jgi:hypothetical protein
MADAWTNTNQYTPTSQDANPWGDSPVSARIKAAYDMYYKNATPMTSDTMRDDNYYNNRTNPTNVYFGAKAPIVPVGQNYAWFQPDGGYSTGGGSGLIQDVRGGSMPIGYKPGMPMPLPVAPQQTTPQVTQPSTGFNTTQSTANSLVPYQEDPQKAQLKAEQRANQIAGMRAKQVAQQQQISTLNNSWGGQVAPQATPNPNVCPTCGKPR